MKAPKRWTSWRVCPRCSSRATKKFNVNSGLYLCQLCEVEYAAPQRETIVAAAILRPGHSTPDTLAQPSRHHNIIRMLAAQGVVPGEMAPDTQGFVTSTGRFVNRVTAYKIAAAAGQLIQTPAAAGIAAASTGASTGPAGRKAPAKLGNVALDVIAVWRPDLHAVGGDLIGVLAYRLGMAQLLLNMASS